MAVELENLHKFIADGNIEAIRTLIAQENLEVANGKLVAKNKALADERSDYYDQIQLVRKIQLNSLYGAVTNLGSEFFDQRLGQSCTLTGRCTTRHMASTINEKVVGTYEIGNAIVYGDTDSTYFTVPEANILEHPMEKDSFLKLADDLAKTVNSSFSDFYHRTFNVPAENTKGVIKCGREICADTAFFIKKKRYAALYYINEKNIRYDVNGKAGKLKIMGLDIKRSDCPEWVQNKLEETISSLLSEKKSEEEILEFIRTWRQEFLGFEPWKMGIPKRVNKLTYYNSVFNAGTRGVTIPGHVRAAINWNKMLSIFNDRNSMRIADGQKTIVCKLKKNPHNIDSIAYPIDQQFLPDWFKELRFDMDEMVQVAIDQKIKNMFGVLGWNLMQTTESEVFRNNFTWE